MTEKEKMLKEMLYNANNDEDLLKERTIAKDLCFKFNQLMPSDVENQKKLLNELLGQIDDTASILASFWCDYGYNIKVGKNFFANHNTVIIDCAPVTFGDNVFIAPNCGFYTAGNPIDTKRRNQGLEFREFDSCLQFFTNQIAQNVDYINAFEFFYCQIRENKCTNMG